MSIKGRSITWLDAAIERGDAAAAVSAAAEMKHATPQLSLDYALAVVVLMSEGNEAVFDRAAKRWVQRWLTERVNPRTSDALEQRRWEQLLDGLPGLEAVTSLSDVCEHLGLERAGVALLHLYPRLRRPASPS